MYRKKWLYLTKIKKFVLLKKLKKVSMSYVAKGYNIAMVHTHPDKTASRQKISAKPSYPEDFKAANNMGIPNVVLSRYAIWVAMPNIKDPFPIIVNTEWWRKNIRRKR